MDYGLSGDGFEISCRRGYESYSLTSRSHIKIIPLLLGKSPDQEFEPGIQYDEWK
jgi:hypothetical protein